ncbi:hypothetical protein TorRG33x02_217630, partial [Trema orientale]
ISSDCHQEGSSRSQPNPSLTINCKILKYSRAGFALFHNFAQRSFVAEYQNPRRPHILGQSLVKVDWSDNTNLQLKLQRS